jgi:hypothetical protein
MTNPEVVVIRGTKANAPENLICGKLAEMGHFCPVEVMRKALAATRTIPEAAEVVAYDHAAIFAEARERCINDATGTCLLEHLTRVAYEHATRTIPEAAEVVVALREALTDDECAICGKPKHRHTTNSGVGMCQIYPIFRSKRAMFDALLNSGKDGA